MSISPLHARPASPEQERRRARLVLLLVMIGIAASLLAYAISPAVRHAVGHAAHSVKHAVTHVFDPDAGKHHTGTAALHLVAPLHAPHRGAGASHGHAGSSAKTG